MLFDFFQSDFKRKQKLAQKICEIEHIKLLDKPKKPVNNSSYNTTIAVSSWVQKRLEEIVRDHGQNHTVMRNVRRTIERLNSHGLPVKLN